MSSTIGQRHIEKSFGTNKLLAMAISMFLAIGKSLPQTQWILSLSNFYTKRFKTMTRTSTLFIQSLSLEAIGSIFIYVQTFLNLSHIPTLSPSLLLSSFLSLEYRSPFQSKFPSLVHELFRGTPSGSTERRSP